MPPWAHAVKYAFVTSETTGGSIDEPLFATGIDSANEICRRLAQSTASTIPALNQAGPWLAWLSTSTTSPSTTFIEAIVPYVRTDTTQIAANKTGLLSGNLQAPIRRDETGAVISTFVWPGTTPLGDPAASLCGDWAAQAGLGRIGSTSTTDSTWSFAGLAFCTDLKPFYCFQQGAVPVELKSFTVE